MIIYDPLYGKIKIEEPILIELLKAPTLLRLRKITQAGIPQKFNSLKVYDRYEHSVGVMLLLRRLGADLEEQVAGLLHDVSHLAFSHVAEWVFQEGDNAKEEFNETLTKKFIEESELKEILRKYGFDVEKISDLHSFNLLKKDMPDINADRGDYSLREIFKWRHKDIAIKILNDLTVHNDSIVLQTPEIGILYAREFLTLQTEYWASHDAVMRYYLFSRILRKLVNLGELTMEDFYGEENPILEIISNSNNSEIKKMVEILSQKDLHKYQGTLGTTVKKKFRYIDPQVNVDGKYIRVSDLDHEFGKRIEDEKKKAEKGMAL